MISRYSVKKPYTVVVAIVLVLILGVVSFGKMNTDLLPSMNLPYAIVITTYPGASPETVETVVTRPIEQAMATVSDIENVSSQSSANMSMVILEFQESTNMDSVTIEMRESLDQISGYWDDTVGKPMIMKLNPDMMPIMIAAVEVDDLEATEVTDYVSGKIEPELESVSGVASVSTTGNITERVDVLIREEKIAEVNKKVMSAIDRQFKENEEELAEAQEELDKGLADLKDGKKELEEGKEQMKDGKNQLATGLVQGQQQMNAAETKISEGEAEINTQLKALEEKKAELTAGLTQLTEGKAQAEQGLEQLNQAQTGIEGLSQAIEGLRAKETELQGTLAAVQEGIALIDQQIAGLELNLGIDSFEEENDSGETEIQVFADEFGDSADDFANIPDTVPPVMDTAGLENARAQLEQKRAELESQAAAIEQGIAELAAQRTMLEEQLNQIVTTLGKTTAEEALAYIAEQNTVIWNTLEELNANEEQLLTAQEQLNTGIEQLNTAKQQVISGKAQLESGKAELETQKILAVIEMSVAEAQLNAGTVQMEQGEVQMEEAQAQLDSGLEQLEDAKEQVKDQTDMNNLITTDLIKGILAGENFSMPAGYVQEGLDEYLVRIGDKFDEVQGLEEMVLLDLGMDGLDPILLKDVADVTIQDDSDEVYARLNGRPGVMLTLEKQTGYSTGDVTDRLLERIEEIETEQPNVHFSVLMDQGVYIDLVIDSVLENMISGAVLAILILLVFLKDIKPTIVIAFSIPISVVAAFVMMYFSGITLNVISLSGLALGIGMLVDNSIVVIENIDRLRQEGVPAKKAAVEGAKQVAGAIAASTLTTVCVFAPIVFTQGITRQLFVDMGLTIAYSLLASLVVALTLVPMMSAGLLRNSKPKRFPVLDKLLTGYGKLLGLLLKMKVLVVLLSFVLFGSSLVLALKNGTAFMPEMESTQVSMTITTESGTPFTDTVAVADQVLNSIEDIEDIESIGAMSGGNSMAGMMGGGSSTDSNSISVYLLLKEEKVLTGEELEQEILARTKEFPCEVTVTTQSMDMGSLGGSGIQVQIKGKDLDELSRISKEVAQIVADTEGTQNVSDGQEETDTEFRIIVNKAKAMEHQLTVAQVFQKVQARLAEAASATTLSTLNKDYSVYVRDEKDEKLTREMLKNLTFEITSQEGEEKTVRLSEIAEFEEASGPQSISRDAQTRYMTVSAQIANGYNIGLVSQELEGKLEDYELPKGYILAMQGEDETINDAMGQLMLMLLLAIVFMYLIMVAQFQSLLSPFIVMFTVPLAFTGGFLALLVADMEVSVIAVIGFVMLSGIIVNNGIVLVDYTNQLRMEGMGKREALIQAGKDRFRPIIMTALTTVLGLSTMAAGNGMGGDMVQPMAVVTIGGLLYGTVLTLFVVPCIYDILNRKKYVRDDARLEDTEDGI